MVEEVYCEHHWFATREILLFRVTARFPQWHLTAGAKSLGACEEGPLRRLLEFGFKYMRSSRVPMVKYY